ncbi:tuberin-like isoform X2 [Dreissena polymorpha]|uniref:tuberin-like isoform X2 n=1 Tax=Dreissena polymorpha TaxID=45954 RepID=UPI002264839D|nr:tuberin-like isoform X2 [Dreissena polymorpha]
MQTAHAEVSRLVIMMSENKLKSKFLNLFTRKNEPVTAYKRPAKDVTAVFTPEILKDIGPGSPGNNRIKTIKELSDVVLKKKLEPSAIEAVWFSIKDLYQPQAVAEKRHVAIHFLQSLMEGQFNNLGILRLHIFNVIHGLTLPENITEKLTLVKILTENGKSLLEFEDSAGRVFLEWFPEMVNAGKVTEFLPLLISIIKFNAAYMDEDIIAGFVRETCKVCNRPKNQESDIKLCLDVLDVVLCYSYLPVETLYEVVAALCRMVNTAKYCEHSWNLMRKLLGTHLGHSCIHAMCSMLQSRSYPIDHHLLRGGIFYIGMALWGSGKVQKLQHTPAAVLPSFLHVLQLGHPITSYEVTLSVQRLVKKYGKDLPSSTWDIVLDILETLLRLLENAQDLSANPRIYPDLHDTLTTIEQLHENGCYSGSLERLFRIIEMCTAKRPEPSVILLISHLAQDISPGSENWIHNLCQLLEKYLRTERRTKIRLKALEVLSFVLSVNKHLAEEELVHNVVLPHLCHVDNETDVHVRKSAIEILLSLAHGCSMMYFLDIISIVEKVFCRSMMGLHVAPFVGPETVEVFSDETDLIDIKAAVGPLVKLFKSKLYTYPPGLCIRLYQLLISHLAGHYSSPRDYCSHTAASVRKSIIECLLSLRADVHQMVGVCERSSDNPLLFSPYVTCYKSEEPGQPPSPTPGSAVPTPHWASLTYLDYTQSFTLFMQCLENERDWSVLVCVLDNLPRLLQNKTIILSAKHTLVDTLCCRLCAMITDRQLGFLEELDAIPNDFTRSDFHAAVFPVLGAMTTYHNFLERRRQKDLIKCLEFGMVSKCAKLCVNALRLSTLEMQEVMMRLLPSVLLQLSKISATMTMAIPVLAFLSSIVRLPKMYVNFVEDEYLSVFAIALPYTNPFKFSHYTVSLAHHVIAIWFIRCRLSFRKDLVPFIQKGLKANVLQQFEDNARMVLANQNQDSSERVRSGSYSEAALRSRRRMQSGSAISRSDVHAPVDEKLAQFHRELTETCTDMMARYTFGNFSALPHRSHMAEFLLAGGQSQTWLLGNKLVTITTSGSGNKAANLDVCEKCQAMYQQHIDQREPKSGRRRHRSAVVFSRSTSCVDDSRCSSQDDITLMSRTSQDDTTLGLDLTGQDVAVQTGASLNKQPGLFESEPLESLILGIKGVDLANFNMEVCNCWCTNWAEIYIRAPSGNLSWMMRIENEASISNMAENQVPDITMLFASMGKKRQRDTVARHSHRIESGSIGEEEYETLYKQHFETRKQESHLIGIDLPQIQETSTYERPGSLSLDGTSLMEVSTNSLGFVPSTTTCLPADTEQDGHQATPALSIPSSDSAKNHDIQLGSLRRTNSSPSVLSGSGDTLSPRDSISDVVQFSQHQRQEKLKSYTKSLEPIASSSSSSSGKGYQESSSNATSVSKDSIVPEMAPQKHLDFKESDKSSQFDSVQVKQTVNKEFTSMLTKQLSPSPASSEASSILDEVGELPSNLKRQRGHTVATVTPAMPSQQCGRQNGRGTENKEPFKVGISPSFVFLQLFHNGQLQVNEPPLLLPNNEATQRAMKILDHTLPYDTHTIGVIYVGRNQTKDEKAIMSNQYGCVRYMRFIQSLGSLLRLRDCDPKQVYLGGLDTQGSDGEFAYRWQDESTQMIFHIATLMPNKESDVNCNQKKAHIGNDYVTVVYNDSGEEYKIGVIKGQFNYVNIVIKPLDYDSNAITLQAKEDIAGILGHTDTKIISDGNLATLVRQIAIHSNLASMVLNRQAMQPNDPYANNWLERLRKIRRLRANLDHRPSEDSPTRTLDDFTQFV